MRENTDQNNSEYGHFLRSTGLYSFEYMTSSYMFIFMQKIEIFTGLILKIVLIKEF